MVRTALLKLSKMKGALQTKKEEAESRILDLEGKIRATDIGSFKFVACAFDSEVQAAEATENPVLIKEALDRAVNRGEMVYSNFSCCIRSIGSDFGDCLQCLSFKDQKW